MHEKPHKGSLLVVFLTVFVNLLGFGIVLPLLPIYANQFPHVDEGGWALGALMASFSVMQFLFAPFWGRLSDRIGRRPVLMIGLAGSVVFYSLFAVATIYQSLFLLFVSRIGAGMAGATVSTAQAYVADSTTLENRPRGMALIGMAFGLGFTFGPLLGLLAVSGQDHEPGSVPGIVAAGLSAIALLLAIFLLPESRRPDSQPAERKLVDLAAVRRALAVPSIALVLVAIFICIFSLAAFETTLSLLIKGGDRVESSPFSYGWSSVFWTYFYIGLTMFIVQGAVVRPLCRRVDEGKLALAGAVMEAIGFAWMVVAILQASDLGLWTALTIVVVGFAFMQPTLNSLLSRRSDPRGQGGILGVGQSVNSLARIAGSAVGIPLLKYELTLPYWTTAALMVVGGALIVAAARGGQDYQETE